MMHTLVALAAAVAVLAPIPTAEAQGCPPGLAKKSPACIPPGQAKGAAGEDRILTGDYVVLHDRDRYNLPPLAPGEQYYRMGDRILRVDDSTKQILDVVALAAELAN